jgi:hypothetical protein
MPRPAWRGHLDAPSTLVSFAVCILFRVLPLPIAMLLTINGLEGANVDAVELEPTKTA